MTSGLSYQREKIKILLLEGIHEDARTYFREHGYTSITHLPKALPKKELISSLEGVHILGIRSRSMVDAEVLAAARSLIAIGCYCIGTNQVDLDEAARRGVAVFNAPYSNTRSVAELTIAEMIMLARRAADKSQKLHRGIWEKDATGCCEVRGKTVGIVGYGHIGPQVGMLAEALGMSVLYFDVVPKLSLGNARAVATLRELLEQSDFVTMHVPELPSTKGMIGARELALMKPGSFFLNLARGTVVDIPALAQALQRGHLGGAAIDVFPYEPSSNDEPFNSELLGLSNVILTPHIGGSTAEAQRNIGIEVAQALVTYSDTGATTGVVNLPRINLPQHVGKHRILHIHRNEPGVLGAVNQVIAAAGGNISGQFLGTTAEIGYLIVDIDQQVGAQVKKELDKLPATIRARTLY